MWDSVYEMYQIWGLLFFLIELEMFGPVMELGIKNAPCRSHPREKQEDESETREEDNQIEREGVCGFELSKCESETK